MLPPNIRSRIHLSKNTRACVHAESGGFVFIDAAFTALPHSLALKETLRLFPSMKQIFLKRVAWLARAGRDATRAQASIPCGTCEVGLSGFAKNNCPVPARYGRLRAGCGAGPTSIVSGLAQREVSRAIGRASCTNPPLSDSDRGGWCTTLARARLKDLASRTSSARLSKRRRILRASEHSGGEKDRFLSL